MKVSVITGEGVVAEINRLQEEYKELDQAVDQIADDMGEHTAPYTLLKKALEEKRVALNKTKARTYAVHEEGARL